MQTNGTSQLVAAVVSAAPESLVRLAADWLNHGDPHTGDPGLTDNPHIDALVAATVAYQARRLGLHLPDWTMDESRRLDSFWHPGEEAFFAWSLAHTPPDFLVHGVIVERDSLESV